ncbi:MAG TPA: type ISP restriction/modification enzyme [Patescibacteria group bacterium]|nr:type ISP restriction/modification enzyme [Patescibacteria group bacterium]
MSAVAEYLRKLEQALRAGNATEHTHRPALKALIEGLRQQITATNEPRRIECGSPDFIVTRKGVPLGYVEAKDVGVDLDRAEGGEQLTRYRSSLRNLILTDYLEFRLYRNGEPVQSAKLATWQKGGGLRREPDAEVRLTALFQAFFDAEAPSIGSPRELAERMARMARLLHDLIRQAFAKEGQTGDLHGQHEAFRRVLIADLSPDQFADMYAQTIAYGLFAARCNHVGAGFTRDQAGRDLPRTNPFLRRLFNTIAGPDLDERISWAVDDLADLLAKADIAAILADFGHSTARTDPVVHFYETFLSAYDPKLRELRGVYYTPEPVVDYIVRSVDGLLRRDFKLADGIADASRIKLKRTRASASSNGKVVEEAYETHRVQILDPACGTGTFLHAIVASIRERFKDNAGMWPGYVTEHLLPRLYGFELLMAPYAIAHMKLGLQLKETGYDFGSDERLRVFLTNTLEEAHEMAGLPLFTQWLAEEAAAAAEVKKNVPIMVVIGNPPYSGHSANKGAWISQLMTEYKKSPELKKPAQAKWLSDDYVKFLRFAQWRIEQTGYGVLAFITNHSYLDNPTFLDMRASLMASFDDLYVLDLHGNSKKKERTPEGGKDENVFDIQQGVAIALFVKRTTRAKSCAVHRADLWGTRATKYEWLFAHDVTNTAWENVTPPHTPWFFVKQDAERLAEYQLGWSVADIFRPNGDPAPGVVTTHDEFAISWTSEAAIAKVDRLLATTNETDARQNFTLCSQSQWSYERAKRDLADGTWRAKVTPILYRPFDTRWTIWDANVAVHRRERVFRHIINADNIALITTRQRSREGEWSNAFVCGVVSESCAISNITREINYIFPLWLYPENGGLLESGAPAAVPNLAQEFLAALGRCLKGVPLSPDDIFAYIYAILYSQTFRIRYADFLRRDFPRIPLTGKLALFRQLAALGHDLIDLHLLRCPLPAITGYPKAGSNRVDKIEFRPDPVNPGQGIVQINVEQHFEGMPLRVWEYTVGGYQVAHKWLKDRKGRLLTFDELSHYGQVIAALAETIRLQKEIDMAIGEWPMEPRPHADAGPPRHPRAA